MFRSPFSLYFDMARLAFEANWVIALRLTKIAAGGHQSITEMQRMVTEKVTTAGLVGVDNAFALAMGKSPESVGKSTVATYRKAVRANHRRLTRRK